MTDPWSVRITAAGGWCAPSEFGYDDVPPLTPPFLDLPDVMREAADRNRAALDRLESPAAIKETFDSLRSHADVTDPGMEQLRGFDGWPS